MFHRKMAIGDKVLCTEPPGTGQLTTDHIYTITEVMDGLLGDKAQIISVDKWPWMMWSSLRFRLAEVYTQDDIDKANAWAADIKSKIKLV